MNCKNISYVHTPSSEPKNVSLKLKTFANLQLPGGANTRKQP